jgi:hypothetical protein
MACTREGELQQGYLCYWGDAGPRPWTDSLALQYLVGRLMYGELTAKAYQEVNPTSTDSQLSGLSSESPGVFELYQNHESLRQQTMHTQGSRQQSFSLQALHHHIGGQAQGSEPRTMTTIAVAIEAEPLDIKQEDPTWHDHENTLMELQLQGVREIFETPEMSTLHNLVVVTSEAGLYEWLRRHTFRFHVILWLSPGIMLREGQFRDPLIHWGNCGDAFILTGGVIGRHVPGEAAGKLALSVVNDFIKALIRSDDWRLQVPIWGPITTTQQFTQNRQGDYIPRNAPSERILSGTSTPLEIAADSSWYYYALPEGRSAGRGGPSAEGQFKLCSVAWKPGVRNERGCVGYISTYQKDDYGLVGPTRVGPAGFLLVEMLNLAYQWFQENPLGSR